MSQIIGVDLGQARSCVVAIRTGESHPRVVTFLDSSGQASDTLATVVTYSRLGHPHVGHWPTSLSTMAWGRTLHSFKRLLGCAYDDPGMQSVAPKIGWQAVADADRTIGARLDDSVTLALSDVTQDIFRNLYTATVAAVGKNIDGAGICVPACFGAAQVEVILNAARAAGWPRPHIRPEPVALAAALANRGAFQNQVVAMCDLGAGKFEASVVEFGAPGSFRLVSTYGDRLLGGDDLDVRVVEGLLAQLSQETGVDLAHDTLAWLRVLNELRVMRPMLEHRSEVRLQLPFLIQGAHGAPLHAQITLTRDHHYRLISDLLVRIEETCRQALAQAGIDRYDTRGNVVATEGYATLPAYRQALEQGFGAPRFILKKHLVAYGAAMLAGQAQSVDLVE